MKKNSCLQGSGRILKGLGKVGVFLGVLGLLGPAHANESMGESMVSMPGALSFLNIDISSETRQQILMSWILFIGVPMTLLRKLLLKGIQHVFAFALIMALIFSSWEVLLFGHLNGLDFFGSVEQQQNAWAFTLLALIRSLSVFLFYARGALDIRLIIAKHHL